MGISFRHSAGFGKRMEYNLVGKMLMEGLDVYLPLVDDHGVDCVIKKEDGTFVNSEAGTTPMVSMDINDVYDLTKLDNKLKPLNS